MSSAGVVLAGGRSLRMGTSKAWLDWHGTTLLERVVAVLGRAVDGPIVVVSAAGQQLPALPSDVRIVTDGRADLGPLQGIATGLEALAGVAEVAFVSSTDAALLHPAFCRRVLAGVTPALDAVVPDARGHRQPLAAVYRVELAAFIDSLLERGMARPGFLYERSATRFVDDAWLLEDPALAAVDPELASLENLNDPEAYAHAHALPAPTVELTLGHARSHVQAFTLGGLARSLGVALPPTVRLNGAPERADPALALTAGDALVIDRG
jgi:molybdopterin-guanine dinucleotide biosynthesis protein A